MTRIITRPLVLFLAAAVFCGAAVGLRAQNLPLPERRSVAPDAETGREVVDDFLSRRPAQNVRTHGYFVMRNEDRRRDRIPMRYSSIVADGFWQDIYETAALPDLPPERLIIVHREGVPNHYFLSKGGQMGADADPVPLTREQLEVPFAGTDFTAFDLGIEFLHWPEQVLVDKEMRKGRSCRVIESRPAAVETAPYARVRSWIDFETGALIRAEAFGRDGKKVKEFSVHSVEKVNGEYRPKEIEIRNEITYSRTRIEFTFDEVK